jgi:hypothetical protein
MCQETGSVCSLLTSPHLRSAVHAGNSLMLMNICLAADIIVTSVHQSGAKYLARPLKQQEPSASNIRQ